MAKPPALSRIVDAEFTVVEPARARTDTDSDREFSDVTLIGACIALTFVGAGLALAAMAVWWFRRLIW